MDDSQGKDIWWIWTQLWPTFVIALVIYGGGITVDRMWRTALPAAKDLLAGKTTDIDKSLPSAFKIWYSTRTAHPFLVGGAIAFVPGLPRPEWVSSTTLAVIWFGLAGMGNGQIHMIVEALTVQVQKIIGYLSAWVRRRIGIPSTPAPPPASDPTPSTSTSLADTLEPTNEDGRPQ